MTDDISEQISAYIGLSQHQFYLKEFDSATDYLNKARTALLEKADSFFSIIVITVKKILRQKKLYQRLEELDNESTIEVSDTGKGIPKDYLQSVFAGFEQVDTGNSREQSGTGLGLVITKGIVEVMGGTISLNSELNKGTQVKIIIPL